MGFIELLFLSVGLAMDAFAVAVCKGLSVKKVAVKNSLTVGAYFGIFQGLMPAIGFLLGVSFSKYINAYDHFIAFVLLSIIGGNMIAEAIKKEDECINCSFSFKAMLPLAVATSIDALAVGVSFAALNMTNSELLLSVLIIGVVTFIISAAGVYIGNIFGTKYKSKAQLFGGVILIIIGLKILIEHLVSGT